METSDLVNFVYDKLDDMKANGLVTLDVAEKSSVTDAMIVCSGTSKRHVVSIAGNLVKEAKDNNLDILGVEGEDAGEWVLIDLSNVVVHVMQESTRDFYQLEKLWG